MLLLSQCARRLGRPTVPMLLPAVTWVGQALRAVGMTDFSPEQIRLLTHGRVVSTVQMRETLGFVPKYSTGETFADFARSRAPGLLPPDTVGRAVDRVAAAVPRIMRHGRRHPPDPERQVEERSDDGGCQGHSVRRRPFAAGRSAARRAAGGPRWAVRRP